MSKTNVNLTCDNCGGEINGWCCWTNGKKLCADCFGSNEIADLKAKLAESEKRFQEHKQTDSKTIQEQSDLIEQLKQQLAEKEKQIKKLNYEAQKYYEDAYCNYFHEKDKASFAVEQLEKVKKQLRQDVNITAPISEIKKLKDYLISVDDYIDNQIKLLKGD